MPGRNAKLRAASREAARTLSPAKGRYSVNTSSLLRCCTASLLGIAASGGSATEGDISRLQQQRAHQQIELQLKMQQQQERASRPAPSAPVDAQLRRFEADQQQRLRQLQDEQSRAAAAARAGQLSREGTLDRSPDARTRASETGQRLNTDRSIAGAR
jgi:hypothetical protein